MSGSGRNNEEGRRPGHTTGVGAWTAGTTPVGALCKTMNIDEHTQNENGHCTLGPDKPFPAFALQGHLNHYAMKSSSEKAADLHDEGKCFPLISDADE